MSKNRKPTNWSPFSFVRASITITFYFLPFIHCLTDLTALRQEVNILQETKKATLLNTYIADVFSSHEPSDSQGELIVYP